MALFVPAAKQMVAELNSKNDAVATLADLLFGVPETTTTEEQTTTGKETKVKITGQGAKYYGETYLYYNRQSLASPFANQLLRLDFHNPVTTLYDQLGLLNEQLSTTFAETDLEDYVFDPLQTEGVLPLVAKAGSLGWKGNSSIAYSVINPALVAIPDVQLDGVMTPNNTTDLEQAALRYSWWDFKDNRDWFLSLTAGDLSTADQATLAAILTTVDGTQWAATGPAEYTLAGAKILYVGNDTSWAVSNLFPNVMVVELSAQCLLMTGRLYLHFSDPEV